MYIIEPAIRPCTMLKKRVFDIYIFLVLMFIRGERWLLKNLLSDIQANYRAICISGTVICYNFYTGYTKISEMRVGLVVWY